MEIFIGEIRSKYERKLINIESRLGAGAVAGSGTAMAGVEKLKEQHLERRLGLLQLLAGVEEKLLSAENENKELLMKLSVMSLENKRLKDENIFLKAETVQGTKLAARNQSLAQIINEKEKQAADTFLKLRRCEEINLEMMSEIEILKNKVNVNAATREVSRKYNGISDEKNIVEWLISPVFEFGSKK